MITELNVIQFMRMNSYVRMNLSEQLFIVYKQINICIKTRNPKHPGMIILMLQPYLCFLRVS